MQEYIKENLNYPDVARNLNISGSIHVFIVVLSDGSLRDIKIVKGLQPDLDKEAIRVVKSMPLWNPGIRGGEPVNVRCVIPITVSPLK
jgi:protein TonB